MAFNMLLITAAIIDYPASFSSFRPLLCVIAVLPAKQKVEVSPMGLQFEFDGVQLENT
jgi:hypothetical protein